MIYHYCPTCDREVADIYFDGGPAWSPIIRHEECESEVETDLPCD